MLIIQCHMGRHAHYIKKTSELSTPDDDTWETDDTKIELCLLI